MPAITYRDSSASEYGLETESNAGSVFSIQEQLLPTLPPPYPIISITITTTTIQNESA